MFHQGLSTTAILPGHKVWRIGALVSIGPAGKSRIYTIPCAGCHHCLVILWIQRCHCVDIVQAALAAPHKCAPLFPSSSTKRWTGTWEALKSNLLGPYVFDSEMHSYRCSAADPPHHASPKKKYQCSVGERAHRTSGAKFVDCRFVRRCPKISQSSAESDAIAGTTKQFPSGLELRQQCQPVQNAHQRFVLRCRTMRAEILRMNPIPNHWYGQKIDRGFRCDTHPQ